MNNEKVLIISHNPLSITQNNGKTLFSFFSGKPCDAICQLYFTLEAPDCPHFDQYFQITDIQMLKRFFGKKIETGKIIKNNNTAIIQEKNALHKNPIYKLMRYFAIKRIPLLGVLRDFLWHENNWKTNALIKWIEAEKPDAVFFQSSGSLFSFKIVKWICLTWDLPLIVETTDDYVTGKFSFDIFFWYQLFHLKRAYQWVTQYADAIITICDTMKDEYSRRFGGNYLVAMNSVEPAIFENKNIKSETDKLTFVFAGNMGIGRWKILSNIGKAFQALENEGIKARLHIYSLNTPSKKVLKHINNGVYTQFKGSLRGNELTEVVNNATCVVHVESFSAKHKHITRLSISTKIPEYMNSQSCIFAVGPSDVASIKYLSDYGIAEVVKSSDVESIKQGIKRIKNAERRLEISHKASKLLYEKHNKEKIQAMVSESISRAVTAHKFKNKNQTTTITGELL